MVVFKEDTHQYFNEEGKEYKSVTTILHKYTTPFDKDKVAARVSEKTGRPVEEILKEWATVNRTACDFGTNIHLLMENYIKKRERVEGYDGLYDSFDEYLADDLKYATDVLSEVKVWDDTARVAGTSDLIVEFKDEFMVGDFKTNKRLDFYSKFRDHMKYPVDHLTDCNYSVYSLQLSIYALMYERLSGKRCRNVFLLYKVGDRWTYITANYMKYEAMALLKHYTLHRNEILYGF